MRPLAVTITLAGGWGRASLVAGTTALVSGLLLAAISMLRLYEAPQWPLDERVLGAVRDPGTRPGAILGVLLLALPLVLLLDQAVRLGTTARRQRFAALAVAGATRSDLRRWGAVEVGLPALVGGVLGIPVWWLLRQVSGPQGTSLVPTSVGPGAWALLAVLMTGAYGAAVGFRMGSRVGKDPTHQTDRPPRPWAALLLIVAAVLLAVGNDVVDSDLLSLGLVSLLVLAIAGLAPWTAFVVASLVASRTARPALLLAGRRLQLDLGPALVAGFGALAALLVIALSLGVHLTESVLERHRELAALVASGVPAEVVSRSQRLECLLATVPLAIVGAAVGGLGYSYLDSMAAATYVLSAVFITGAASAGACWLVTALLRPWLLDALQPEHLRTA